jgi:hypothetical protein
MIDIKQVVALQNDMVARWHIGPVLNSQDGTLGIVCEQHRWNFLLWHEEDIARSPVASDREIAEVKRAIDRYNQQRNDWIERLDDHIAEQLEQARVALELDARLNTETPGSAIDRLSIMALRIYHLEEQLQRSDASPEHRSAVQGKLNRCRQQQTDLIAATQRLIHDIFAGKTRHRTYRQYKMYNDPNLNPQIYNAAAKRRVA